MPTGRSSAEPIGRESAAPGAVRSLGPLLRLRLGGLTGRGRVLLRAGTPLLVLVTLSSAVVPALVTLPPELMDQVRTYLPIAVLGFLVTSTIAVVSAGGGREIIPAEQAVAFPVGTPTDHLASLLLAPVNLAWLVQAWALLAGVAAVTGPERLWAAQLPILLWIGTATAVAQVVAWLIEVVRLGRGGVWVVRGATVVLAVTLLAVATTGHLVVPATSLGAGSVVELTRHGASGSWSPWAAGVVLLAVLAAPPWRPVPSRTPRGASTTAGPGLGRVPRLPTPVHARQRAASPDPGGPGQRLALATVASRDRHDGRAPRAPRAPRARRVRRTARVGCGPGPARSRSLGRGAPLRGQRVVPRRPGGGGARACPSPLGSCCSRAPACVGPRSGGMLLPSGPRSSPRLPTPS